MYLQHFSLQKPPFGLTPNTQFYCGLPTHQEALNVLLVALNSGEGFIKITGEVGTGKTLLCRKLLHELDDQFVTAYLPNPHLSPAGLRMALADELGIEYPRNLGQSRLIQRINEHLIELAANGKKAVLLLDEAQALSTEGLETLRLLTNLETESQKLLQVVLFAQPELDQRLAEDNLRQLLQRITFSYRIQPLDAVAVQSYLLHRCVTAGYTGTNLFNEGAIRLLAKYSRGIPRLINILAHKALMASYGQGLHQVQETQVKQAAADTESVEMEPPRRIWSGWSFAALALIAVVGASWYLERLP